MAKQDRKRINRAIALVASVVLAVGLVPVPAIAVGTGDELGGLASEASPAAATPDAVPLTQGDEGTASDEQPAKAERADDNGSETGAVASGDGKDDSGADSADSDGAAAADSDGGKGQPSDEAEQTDDDEASAKSASSDKDKDKNEGKDAKSESPAFAQSATVDGVTVAVEADAGVFPEGARLSVESVPSAKTEAAVAPERDAYANVVASCTFDVKVLDANGKEIQPADGRSVKVSFKAAEVADPNLDVSVYHVAEGAARADKLDVDVSGKTATAESSGFSFYTVEFTYGDLQYVLKGGEKVALADVLAAVGLSGEATGVEVSDPALFSASKESGGWVITSHEAFSSDEWMRVTIAGRAYEIKVTDSQVEGDYTYVVSSDGAENAYAWITGYSGAGGAIAIPSELGGVPVKIIGFEAFKGKAGITSVTIPASVTDIYDWAFRECTYLASVVFQGAVGNIGNSAFRECSSLGSVVFQGAVGSIGDSAFSNCSSLGSVVFQGAVTNMESGAFDGCSSWNDVYCYGTQDQWMSCASNYWGTGNEYMKPREHYTACNVTTSPSPGNGGSSKVEWTWRDNDDIASSGNLTATPAEGYHFASWTKGGAVVSTDNPCRFDADSADSDAVYVANFEPNSATYTISAAADPVVGGTVSGGGTFTYGQKATLTAEASEGYVFDCWTEDGSGVNGAGAEYTFPVTANRTLVANFRQVSIRDIVDQVYTGSAIEPKGLHVELLGVDGTPANVVLVENEDYTLSYENNVNVGKGTVIVTFIDKFTGRATKTFDIKQASLEGATVAAADQVYDGTAQKPVPTVTWNGKEVAQDDYTATYANNVRAGTATVTVTGKHNFTEASKASGTFKIAKRPATVTADSAERVYDGKPLTADGFTSEGLAEGDKVASAKVEGSQTDVGSSANKVSGAKIVNAADEDVTDCYDITYKDGTLTVKPGEKGSYEAASGSGSTWTKGSTDPVTLTFKRATDDERTFDLFKGVEVDGKAVPEKDASGKANWTAKKGSLILSLQPSFLETLSTGKHTVTAVFDDGSASATFTVEAKASPTPASGTTKGTSTSASPKTGDETGGTVVVLSVTAGAALCLALFALSQRKRRKPAHAGKHARR